MFEPLVMISSEGTEQQTVEDDYVTLWRPETFILLSPPDLADVS